MKRCGCLLALLSLGALGFVVYLALQPINEPPPTITAEAAARADQKLAQLSNPLAAAQAGEIALSEEEINSKLAQTLAGLRAKGPLRSLFVRLRPGSRVVGVGTAEVFGRPVGGTATLHIVPAAGGQTSGTVWEAAQIGALPLPVGFFTRVALPWLERNGVSVPSVQTLPAGASGVRIEGGALILSGRKGP